MGQKHHPFLQEIPVKGIFAFRQVGILKWTRRKKLIKLLPKENLSSIFTSMPLYEPR